jgi:hypothetical protein
MATAASAAALLAPAASAQVPSVSLPAVPDVAPIPANPPAAAISDQYREIEAVVQQALPAAPAAKPAPAPVAPPAPKPAPAPKYHPAADQYHSETPDVTVTQTQPENVNVSIRINSPGDDGPVTQINGAGADIDTSIVQAPPQAAPPPATAPDAPPASGLPDNWTWVWTSACFGGSGGGADLASAAGAGPSWDWQWSCAQDDPVVPGDLPQPDDIIALVPDPGQVVADVVPGATGLLPSELSGAPPPRPRARPERASRPGGTPSGGHGPPPPSRSSAGLLAAGPRAASTTAQPAAAVPRRAQRGVRHAVQARARSGATPDFPQGAGGPSAGAATGLGAAMSLLLGSWIAVLACALSLVIPRIWLRRWSGPLWRWPSPRSTRLERPG